MATTQYWAVETTDTNHHVTTIVEVNEGQTAVSAWQSLAHKSPTARLLAFAPTQLLAGQALDLLTSTNDPQMANTTVIEGYFGGNDLWYAIRFHHPQSKVSIGVCNNQSKSVSWISVYTLSDLETNMARWTEVMDMVSPDQLKEIRAKARMTLGD